VGLIGPNLPHPGQHDMTRSSGPTRTTTGATPAATGARRRARTPIAPPTQDWYKDAIIYELHVRAFQDSDGDGIGDFRGLTSRLDYLQDLGVTAIWLLPFYPSPLRDDGYDIADYTAVHPDYGTMADFRRFVTEAHKRDLRVITELVINHTSDQHPWFQRARRAPPGSKHRDFYVWSDSPERYPGVRIIFQDTETSNWAWDPVAQQYYWHRFFSHQPDLNYDNPAVREAVIKVMDFWFEAGVDGMRLDAVPYLVEREGTNCENLPETHEVLRELRAHLDRRWPERMFLAEANQWPEDAIAYFGEGDECQMNFHFPLMPRLFMSLRMEDRFPIVDILNQTPPIPDSCQWAMFLRNHDELTLEMVTDEERDYMYRTYASDRQMRINLGIRRRLAPLLEQDRRKIELMNGLLMSMPGTPVLYYGDEIGMGDNVYLGDRDAVRTPMQWSSDRNAGFSRANPQRLYLPVIIDPGSHYENINVESQQANTSSLLWWTKRLLALRKRHGVLARGGMEFLHPENPKVIAFLRTSEDEDILVLANLSRFAQPVELDLSRFEGRTPVEIFGYTRFPPIGELPYFLTLGPHTFYWFQLERPAEGTQGAEQEPPTIETQTEPAQWLRGPGLKRWVTRGLAERLRTRRWFAGKSRTIRECAVEDLVPMGSLTEGVGDSVLALVRVEYTEGDDELYTLPLALLDPERAVLQSGVQAGAVLASLKQRGEGGRWVLIDGTGDEALWRAMNDLIARRRTLKGSKGSIHGVRVAGRNGNVAGEADDIRVARAEQSNSSAILGQSSIMKLFRRVEEGVNPDFEIGQHLTRSRRFAGTPDMRGAVEYRRGRDRVITLATKQELVPNEGDAWQHTLDAVGRYFERVLALPELGTPPARPASRPLEHARRDPSEAETHLLDGFLDNAHLLGQRTAEMHVALADSDHPDFAPERLSKLYLRSLYQSMRNGVQRPLQALRSRLAGLEGETRPLADEVVANREEVLARIGLVREIPLSGVRIRCHGDYHLGQVLWTGMDFSIIDFEGEPMRPLGERRLKRSCLSDVAGMCRSLHYAANAGLRDLAERGIVDEASRSDAPLLGWAEYWVFCAQASLLRGFLGSITEPLIPDQTAGVHRLLEAWTLQKAAYEIGYELNNRPHWLDIPLRGMLAILETPPWSDAKDGS